MAIRKTVKKPTFVYKIDASLVYLLLFVVRIYIDRCTESTLGRNIFPNNFHGERVVEGVGLANVAACVDERKTRLYIYKNERGELLV